MEKNVSKATFINASETLNKLLEQGETVDSLTDKTLEFMANVQSLFDCISNLYAELKPGVLGLGRVAVVCNMTFGDTTVSSIGIGASHDMLFCANNLLNKVTAKVKSDPQEKSEP